MATKSTTQRRGFGVIRVSRDRDGISPKEQRDRLVDYANRNGIELVKIVEELDVSGGTPLAKRAGLREAVEGVEDGLWDTILGGYFDRLVRSLNVQEEMVTRVEAKGGTILAIDYGEVSNKTVTQWYSATMIGAMAEYWRRASAERNHAAKVAAVMRGVPPFPHLPLGLQRNAETGVGEHDPNTVHLARAAFKMRADGATRAAVRDYLAANGANLSLPAVRDLLASRMMLGELRFGEMVNTDAWPAVVDLATWRRVQEMVVPRGRHAKSVRLLARQGVLRCGSCGARMSVSTNGKGYANYRCASSRAGCKGRVNISAPAVERHIEDKAQELLKAYHGTAALSDAMDAADARVERAQFELENAVEAFSGLANSKSAKAKLARLDAEVTAAESAREDLRRRTATMKSLSGFDIRRLSRDRASVTLDDWRGLIRLAIDRAVVAPGRGTVAERVTIFPREVL